MTDILLSNEAMQYINMAANILPFNGITTGELSDKYGNLFTPAG